MSEELRNQDPIPKEEGEKSEEKDSSETPIDVQENDQSDTDKE